MGQLSTKRRASLPDSAFAYIDSHGRRRLPVRLAGPEALFQVMADGLPARFPR